ncbi:MAG: alanine--tRNA ligase [Alphaproteobacteria bacterium]|nr:MAG: alanine--tRNA ligase [Alphaproteobacteria bacterium]
MKVEAIRLRFLSYFAQEGHSVIASAPLVPHNDPTLMFVNAGMVPFKNIFTGKEPQPTPPRYASAQKCVRAGGKHNDLDNVGYTARHHTFFEMMGNFSFGDYFKEDAIHHAWTFLTKELGLKKEKLYVTVYHTDDEAFDLWKKIAGLDDARILRVPTNDNFWSMGDTGPCGPCSEIFYDHGADAGEGQWALDAQGNDLFGARFVEIWNLVFMQYEQVDKDTRINLPKPCVDTGMGLERMASVMQGVHNNYHTDLFQELIREAQLLLGTPYADQHVPSYHVIADHLRSCSFLIADGVLPANEGRGYVLRRIMRRAMRHAHMLGAKTPVMHQLVGALQRVMGAAYPELVRADALIRATLRTEEERFRETLGRGLKLLEEEKKSLTAGGVLAGDVAFKLYDTYGFPLDLTQDILRGSQMQVDVAAFDAAMDEQRTRARAAWKGSGAHATDALWFDLHERYGVTEFLGYTQEHASALVQSIVRDGAEVTDVNAGDVVQIILNQTPCYGESGGQIGDAGRMSTEQGAVIAITDTTIPVAGLYVHHVRIEGGCLRVGDTVEVRIDHERRERIRANHSATHLLHAALRAVLGEHVSQKGSLVTEDKLRFDFSHNSAVRAEEIQRIEEIVNAQIWGNSAVTTRIMTPEDAMNAGAMALFGEKYGEEVRVLSMGHDAYSVELCGGTHVQATGDIGMFVITSESAIAAGVRRIEAATRLDAYAFMHQQRNLIMQSAQMLTATTTEVPARIMALLEERKASQKEMAQLKRDRAMSQGGEVQEVQIGDITILTRHMDGLPAKELRAIAMELMHGRTHTIVALTTNDEGKGSVLVAVSSEVQARYPAPSLVQIATPILGGTGGGGKPDMAQGGGADGSKAKEALAAIIEALR